MASEPAGHLVDRDFRDGEDDDDRRGSIANNIRTCENLQSEAIEITGMSHLEIECTRLHTVIA